MSHQPRSRRGDFSCWDASVVGHWLVGWLVGLILYSDGTALWGWVRWGSASGREWRSRRNGGGGRGGEGLEDMGYEI